ncbi:acylneuraminate cytidylyltransferase family protein [Reichenbachiella carrageenanivorans]|uniref:Acylneuraminate cytidylyltransferase family protein n=1 Tax=Reichenbachiella carrageenanivorans TaxID=2979869 RepID=A0ABY6D599_9BACT|nr:acylneuraminate cytidylyltransferase family protein [Reichenbachiella carrageenanivorans]UXX81340.1 acylneuraminate cytidylyltransferase family protein [Reichenbachiella carrageenanivorans]
MNRLVIIPARSGSRGIPGKNIKLLKGKPLIQYTIEAARAVFNDDEIIVSTDSEEIKKVVETIGLKVPFLRPQKFSTDTSSSKEVIDHALSFYEKHNAISIEQIILLQPTSPFRNANHIKEALAIYSRDLDMVVSVKETDSNPYYVLFEEDENNMLIKSKEGNFIRRQDCPKVWEYNGAIYIINATTFKKDGFNLQKKKKYIMSELDSVDIDTYLDWKIAECLIVSSSSLY